MANPPITPKIPTHWRHDRIRPRNATESMPVKTITAPVQRGKTQMLARSLNIKMQWWRAGSAFSRSAFLGSLEINQLYTLSSLFSYYYKYFTQLGSRLHPKYYSNSITPRFLGRKSHEQQYRSTPVGGGIRRDQTIKLWFESHKITFRLRRCKYQRSQVYMKFFAYSKDLSCNLDALLESSLTEPGSQKFPNKKSWGRNSARLS